MKTIRLTADFPQLIDSRSYIKGDVVHVRDLVAEEKIKAGAAELAEGEPVVNPGVNHLADAIDPPPPPGSAALVVPDDPTFREKPGQVELDRALKTGKPRAVSKP